MKAPETTRLTTRLRNSSSNILAFIMELFGTHRLTQVGRVQEMNDEICDTLETAEMPVDHHSIRFDNSDRFD